MMTSTDRAIHLAQHYFRLIATRAGIKWDSDNDAEIAELIEAIIAASAKG